MPPKKEAKRKANNSKKDHEIKKKVVNLEEPQIALNRNPSENSESFHSPSEEINIKDLKLEKGNSHQNFQKSFMEHMKKTYPDIILQRAIIFESINKTVNHFSYNFDKKPEEFDEPFSDFSHYVMNLKLTKKITNVPQMTQRLFFQCTETKKQYVIFRDWKKFKEEEEKKGQSNPELEIFTEGRYDKFVLMKYLSISPNFVNPIALNIIVAGKLELIISEMMVESTGDPLSENSDKSPEFTLLCFIQLIDVLAFLQSSKISLCEVRPENILVDKSSGNIIIKLSDYDLIPFDSTGLENLIEIQNSGLHPIFSSPEALKSVIFKSQKEEFDTLYCMSQIYSIGMTILFLMGFFSSNISLEELLNIKLNEEKYKEFILNIEEYSTKGKSAIEKNLLRLVKICLKYDSQDRLNPGELSNLIRGIQMQEENEEIEKKYSILKKKAELSSRSDYSQYASKSEQDIQGEIVELSGQCEHLKQAQRSKLLEKQQIIDLSNIDIDISNTIERIMGPINNEISTNYPEKTNEQIFGSLISDNIQMAQKITYYLKILVSLFLKESNYHWNEIISKVGDFLPKDELDKFKKIFYIIINELEILIKSITEGNSISKIGLEINSKGDVFIGQLELKSLFKFGIFITKGYVYIGTFDNISYDGI